jgi:hypothetical protein
MTSLSTHVKAQGISLRKIHCISKQPSDNPGSEVPSANHMRKAEAISLTQKEFFRKFYKTGV